MKQAQVFISYAGHDSFEASLLQFSIEVLLEPQQVTAWTFQRDQSRSENEVAKALKKSVQDSIATIFIVSPSTIEAGAAQWMELAYSDAFDVETFVLLHHLDYNGLKNNDRSVPPLLLASQCNSAMEWREVVEDIRNLVKGAQS